MRILLFLILSLLSSAAVAERDSYLCTVKGAKRLADNGILQKSPSTVGAQIGDAFAINRAKGSVVGGFFDNSRSEQIVVLDPGSDQQSFKLLSIWGPIVSTMYIDVREYYEGTAKPFIALRAEEVYTGVCK